MADESLEPPLNWRIVFAIVFAIGVPLSVAVRIWWIPHTLGSVGVGFTIGYAVVLALMWTGRAPRERKPPQPTFRDEHAWVYFRMIGGNAWLTIVNVAEPPL